MKAFSQSTAIGLLALEAAISSHALPIKRPTNLKHWPAEAAAALDAMIAQNAHKGNYACFDMDNTSYRYDVEESLLPFLESRGIITRDTLDPSLKLIEFKDSANYTETLYSYYNRLCDIDDNLCYPWAAQVFSGFTLAELKVFVDELMAYGQPINTTYLSGDDYDVVTPVSVNPPRIFAGQVELYNELMNNGIDVYVVSAASEDIVRMVASDPKYGYNVPPEKVIGVAMLLNDTTDGTLTLPRLQIEEGTYDSQANLPLTLTPVLWAPLTWYSGKWAAILEYINEWKKPVLVAGDTPHSDGYMLFHGVDTSKGGIHLWINRSDAYLDLIHEMIANNTAAQIEEGLEVTADKNWVVVEPTDIQ